MEMGGGTAAGGVPNGMATLGGARGVLGGAALGVWWYIPGVPGAVGGGGGMGWANLARRGVVVAVGVAILVLWMCWTSSLSLVL